MKTTDPSKITFEPFTAGFSGTLISFKAKDGMTYTLRKPYMKITKGQHFMLQINRQTLECRLIAIVAPHPNIHS
jgi:hypothetical protein